MHIRCPHCHNPVEIVDGSALTEIACPSCGSNFSLLGDDATTSYVGSRPQTIGHFQLIDRLGTGSFGTVWKARDTELDRTVAIKIPRRDKLDTEEAEQFLREARAAAQLRHPGIVAVHEVGRHDGTIYIVSDFVEGATLADRLTDESLTAREAAVLCAAIADALHHAHEAGVIHRDLKPANIMLERSNSRQPAVKLMDFGLARREAGEITMTVDGKILGTPAYMSPEQARGEAHTADRRTDIYSLGVILFELLTGEKPFRGNARMLIQHVLHDEPPSPRKLNASVPRDLETICLKCLEKEPRKRYATAKELGDDLRRYLRGEPIAARPIGSLERGWRWVRRYPARAGMVAAVALALVAGAMAVVGLVYQQQLETANAQLELSVDREKKLSGDLRMALKAAEDARAAEAKAKDALDESYYFRRVNLALAEWNDNEVGRALQLLAECPPKHRHWEWHYVDRLCHPELLTLKGHTAPVSSVAYSPDAKRIISGSGDKTVKVWDAITGAEMLTLKGHKDAVSSVAFSPDGKRIASTGNWDKTVKVWNAITGAETLTLKGHTDIVTSVAYSPDGKRIASACSDGTMRIWDAITGTEALTLKGHTGSRIIEAAFSPDGKRIASAYSDGTIRIWDARSGKW